MSQNGDQHAAALKEKRDGIELAMKLLDPVVAKPILDCFMTELQESLLAMLDAGLTSEQTMYQKQRVLAVANTLDRMGVKLSKALEFTTARVARHTVKEALRVPMSGLDDD